MKNQPRATLAAEWRELQSFLDIDEKRLSWLMKWATLSITETVVRLDLRELAVTAEPTACKINCLLCCLALTVISKIRDVLAR